MLVFKAFTDWQIDVHLLSQLENTSPSAHPAARPEP